MSRVLPQSVIPRLGLAVQLGFRFGGLLLGFVALRTLAAEAPPPPGVVIQVSAGAGAADWQAVLTAELSDAATWTVLERADWEKLWTERTQRALSQSGDALSAPSPVAVYLNVRGISQGRWIIEAVNGADGGVLGSGLAESDPTARSGTALASQARTVLTAALAGWQQQVLSPKKVRVAVVDHNARGNVAVLLLASRLRAVLGANHWVVLDRSLTQEVVIERNEAERGFRASSPAGAFLGVDYWVELVPSEARLIRAADGVVLGVRSYDPGATEAVDQLLRWVRPLVSSHTEREATPYLPTIEVEALGPFYRGMVLYDNGRYADASADFNRAYQLNGRFSEAFEWEARCYEALGMVPLATALRRYVSLGLLENISAAGARTAAGTGVAFLGVSAPDDRNGALAQVLSGQAASALAQRPALALRIPEQLDALRREFDWMSGVNRADGLRWEQAPNLFCPTAVSATLRHTPTGLQIDWIQRETLSAWIVSSQSLHLGANPATWPKALEQFLRKWPVIDAPAPTPVGATNAVPPAPTPSSATPELVKALADTLAAATGYDANVARLKLALLAPSHPLAIGRGFVKGGDLGEDSLDGFLEYAMREWLMARLPAGSEDRRWLELACVQEHLANPVQGKLHAGQTLDGLAGLRTLIDAGGNDPAGLVARYCWLFEQQARMPPAELAAACATLHADVKTFGLVRLPDAPKVLNLIESLGRLAQIADGHTEVEAWAGFSDQKPISRRINVTWDAAGRAALQFARPEGDMRHLSAMNPNLKVAEASAALAINGRGSIPGHFDERWLTAFPQSLTLTSYIAHRLNQSTRIEELPIAHPLDWAKASAVRSACIDYAVDSLVWHLQQVKTKEALVHVDYIASEFFSGLNTHDLLEQVSDEAYEAMRERVQAPYQEAIARFQHTPNTNSRLVYWTKLTRALARQDRQDHLRWPGNWVHDRQQLMQSVTTLEQSLLTAAPNGRVESPGFDPTRWWDLLRRWEFDEGLTATEMAAIYLRRTPEVLRRFADQQPTAAELPKLYEHALVLFYGREEVAAEQVFLRVLAIPEGTYPSSVLDEYRANAAFRLAQLFRLAGRMPEALAMAQRGVQLDCTGPHRLIQQRLTYIWNSNSIAGHLLRLLRELRHDPAQAQLPIQVGVVSVPTPNGDNPLLHVFYRQPPTAGGALARRRVLVLAPVHNQDALDYVRPGSAWAQFADEHGLVLVVPQFYVSDRIFRADHRFTHVRNAQIWSGDALLRALDQIDRTVPIDKNHLLLHGVASGAGFACHFAAWRPDLIAAVSVNNGNWGMPRYREVGLLPMSAQHNVRYFITAAAEDTIRWAYDYSVDFVTRLRGAGVTVDWRVWPGHQHTPSSEMEAASRAFLVQQLSSTP